MPKAPSIPHGPSPVIPYPNPHGGQPNVLKRNQACHQCRRRKLKCDAKRPCSTCVRSHAHAVNHAPAGTYRSAPECTYDEIAEANVTVNESRRDKYERLESRISELEALLLQKENAAAAAAATAASTAASTTAAAAVSTSVANTNPPPQVPDPHLSIQSHVFGQPTPESKSTSPSVSTFPQEPIVPVLHSPLEAPYITSVDPFTPTSAVPQHPLPPSASNKAQPHILEIQWPNWPNELPAPSLLRHLIEVFFVFHPHATRLFHAPSFMASLSLPPSHPKFPAVPVLHALCALSSLYTAAVSSPPLPDFGKMRPDEIFPHKYRMHETRPDSFAEQQARLAKETVEHLENLGENLLQCLQARIVLSWFYWSHSRWVDVFLTTAHTLRVVVPLGLNMCPPFHSIARAQRPPSILPPARTVIEDEIRRNVFWFAYAAERQHGLGNGWCLCMDDQDISQLMPVRGDQFERGILVTPHERQWAHSRDLLLTHPESQTDSFILYIKGTILLSRVKVFNHRFRSRHFAGDAAVTCTQAIPGDNYHDVVDPRGSQAFRELDHLVSSFRASFPSHLRNPIVDNVVDNHLYAACLMPHVATIFLHDPHAEVRRSGCRSALEIMTSARGILDLIYNVWSTSFDITLLDSFCVFCWFTAGRVLVRFLQSAITANSEEQIATLKAEVGFVRLAIIKFSERIPLAYRFTKMLDDLIAQATHSLPPPMPTSDPLPSLAVQLAPPPPQQQQSLPTGGVNDLLYDPQCNLDELLTPSNPTSS